MLLLIGPLLTPSAARGQSTTTGAIAGVVRDTTGAVLPGVTVEAASPALIEKVRSVITDAQGNFKIVDLRPGTYSVTFTLTGFSTYKREGIELTTGFTATANADMKVGALEETVTVTGASPIVDIQNTRGQNVLQQETLEALPIGRTNAGFAELTLGAASVTGGAAVVDQGGSKGDSSQRLTVHGMRPFDQRIYFDGFFQNNLLVSGKSWMTNQMGVQEVIVGTGVGSSEIETSGMQINMTPRDGGNKYSLNFVGAGTSGALQASNIDDAIRSTGVTSGQTVKNIYDWGAGIGGPIKKDKLWFYTSHRWWGSTEYQPGAYYNKSPTPFAYVPDLTRQSYAELYAWDSGIRFTWQAAAKHKINFTYNVQKNCQCYLNINSTVSPESAPHTKWWPAHQPIVTWNYARSNRLLFEAGVTYRIFVENVLTDNLFGNAPRVQEQTTGQVFAANSFGCCSAGNARDIKQNFMNQRFSMTFVGGSHAFKIGEQLLEGFHHWDQSVTGDLWYTFTSGRPTSLTQWATPATWDDRIRNLGLFAQDQWTMRRLTLNLGVRYDRYVGWVPAGSRAPGQFVQGFSFGQVSDVPNFNDVSPRIGAVYDVFGNSKTAIKGAIGGYVGALGVEFQDANNPVLSLVISTTRTWNDANGNFTPDCTLTSLDANGECGAVSNRLFGQPFVNTFYDPGVVKGWGSRPYNWQGMIGVQQELGPGLGLNVTYYRTWYSNFTVTDNTLVAASDFNSYCVTAPADARLPNGGGNQICGLYDVSSSRFGQVRNLVTAADAFGKQVERYDGVDANVTARFGRGGIINGGISLGRQQYNNCYVNSRPDLTTTNQTVYAPSGGTLPRSDAYCNIVPPWSAGTQVKANGYYPLPWWGLEPSFTLQNLAGAQVLASQTISNSAIAPSLGRNLSSCGAAAVCTATVSVALIPPQTVFLDRVTTLNLGMAKIVRIGRGRVKGTVDVYNVFNASTVLNVNGTYGPSWLRPTSIIGGRLAKLGAQVDF
jgi:hypothetical protein